MTTTTVALVHGAFTDSSAWDKVAEGLEAHGHLVRAVPNPLRSLSSDAAYVHAVLATFDRPVVLVGHSYGGAVIGEAARAASNVRALVFLAAYLLEEGESIATVLDPATFPGSLLGPDTTLVRQVPNPASGGVQDGELWIRNEDFQRVFIADAPAHQAHSRCLAQRPLALSAFRGIASAPAWRTIPSWALVTEDDRIIPAAGQRWMAGRAGARTSTVAAGHAVMVTQPRAVIDVVQEAATAVGSSPAHLQQLLDGRAAGTA